MGFEPTTSRLLSRVLYQLPAASYFLRLSFSELSDAAYCQNPLQSSWLGYSALTQATWVRGPVAEFMHLPSPAWRGQRNLLSHNRSSSKIEWGSRLFSVIYLGQCFEKGTRIATAPGHFGYPGSSFPEYAV